MNMTQTTIEPKSSIEVIPIIWTYDDTDRTITEAKITVSTYSGVDINPQHILINGLIVLPRVITQYIGRGVVGCTYKIVCNYTMNDLSVYANVVYISIVDE